MDFLRSMMLVQPEAHAATKQKDVQTTTER